MQKANILFRLKLVLFMALLMPCVALPQPATLQEAKPKYIFLFIGDGMGKNQRQAAESALNRKLAINHLTVSGTTTTHNVDGKVTDSAAAGTAIACGVKTKNGMLGLAPDGQVLESIAVKAKKAGMKVGVISSVSLDHATPAAFYAHTKARSNYEEIAGQLGQSGFDFFGGNSLLAASKEKSEALQRIKEHGYRLIPNPDKLAEKYEGKVFIYRSFVRAIDESEKSGFSLAQITSAAIRSLDQENGFFLMVEGGAIDWAGHGNDAAMAVRETEEFDLAVQEALNFIAKQPEKCLIVVTADHETGGMTIIDSQKTPGLLRQTGSGSIGKLGSIVAALAEKNAGADVYLAEVKRYFQLDSLTDAEEKELRQSWKKYLIKGAKAKGVPPAKDAMRLFNQRCGITWTTGGHTGEPVQTTATGIGADAFAGNYDNTDICRRMEKLLPAGANTSAKKK